MRPLLLLAAFTAFCVAQPSPEEVLRNVRRMYSGVTDASATFTQTVAMRFGAPRVQTGTVVVKKGNRYRIETAEQTFCSDGTTVWMATPASNQVLVDAVRSDGRLFSPDAFLAGLPTEMRCDSLRVEATIGRLSMTPTGGAASRTVRSLTAWVDLRSWTVTRVEYTDRNRTSFTIVLSGVTFNAGMPDSRFRYVPPKGMKVVDLRSMQ